MIVLKNSLALLNQPAAHIFGEMSDMRLIRPQGELILDPSVSVLSGQDSVLPDHIKHPMCADPQIAQIPVCKRTLGNLRTLMDSHIEASHLG